MNELLSDEELLDLAIKTDVLQPMDLVMGPYAKQAISFARTVMLVAATRQKPVAVLVPTTKDGIEVKVGQIWEDCDKRMNGRQRRIYAIEGDKVVMGRVDRDTGSKTKVSISRLRPVSGGWKLVG